MKKLSPLFLGFDIGGSSVKWGYGNCQQGVLRFESLSITSKDLDCLKSVFLNIFTEVDNSLGLDQIAGIGIGTPGTIERSSGMIRGTNPNLSFWTDISPSVLIPTGVNIPLVYDNDANLMCLGESTLWEGITHMVGITVGSGIGCGYVHEGRPFGGAHGFAMELGHVTVVPHGVICNCGRGGCLEAYSSVDGIKRRAAALKDYPEAGSWDLRDLLKHARTDKRLSDFIHEGETMLARALSDLTVLIDPQLIVLGGGGMDGKLYDINSINALMQEALPIVNRGRTRLELAKAGNRAGVLGAVSLAESELSRG